MIYSYVIDEVGDRCECQSCGYPAQLGVFEFRDTGRMLLCQICAETHISSVTSHYPQLYDDSTKKIMGSLGWIANLARDEMKGRASNADP